MTVLETICFIRISGDVPASGQKSHGLSPAEIRLLAIPVAKLAIERSGNRYLEVDPESEE